MLLRCFMTVLYYLHSQAQRILVGAFATMRRERRSIYSGRLSMI